MSRSPKPRRPLAGSSAVGPAWRRVRRCQSGDCGGARYCSACSRATFECCFGGEAGCVHTQLANLWFAGGLVDFWPSLDRAGLLYQGRPKNAAGLSMHIRTMPLPARPAPPGSATPPRVRYSVEAVCRASSAAVPHSQHRQRQRQHRPSPRRGHRRLPHTDTREARWTHFSTLSAGSPELSR